MRRIAPILACCLFAFAACSSEGSDSSPGTTEAADPSEATTTTSAAAEPLDDQTPPASINGLTVDGDTLWVASINADQVVQVDRESGAILQRFDTDGAAPDDVALAPDGSVWVSGFGSGELGRIADGTYEVVTEVAPAINPLEFDEDGTLLVATYGPGGVLYSLETDGGAPIEGAEPEVVATDLPDINAFGVLDDGTLLAPAGGIGGPGAAVRIDPATGEVTTVASDLSPVAAGATDVEGNPFLLANALGELYAIDVDASSAELVGTYAAGAPYDNLAFSDDGTLYLSNFLEPVIIAIDAEGTASTINIGSQ